MCCCLRGGVSLMWRRGPGRPPPAFSRSQSHSGTKSEGGRLARAAEGEPSPPSASCNEAAWAGGKGEAKGQLSRQRKRGWRKRVVGNSKSYLSTGWGEKKAVWYVGW